MRRALTAFALLVAFAVPARADANVTVTGWATFSGASIAVAADKAGDAAVGSAQSGADILDADLVYRPEQADLFVRIRLTEMPHTGAAIVGDPSVLYVLRTVVANVPVEIRAQSAGATQLFGLFTCASENGCLKVADLVGGYGTTGVEVVAAVPLSVLSEAGLKLTEGGAIGTPAAYTARLPYLAPAVPTNVVLDGVVMARTATVVVPARSVRVSVGSVTRAGAIRDGRFTVTIPRSAFRSNPDTAVVRTCLGTRCALQRLRVAY